MIINDLIKKNLYDNVNTIHIVISSKTAIIYSSTFHYNFKSTIYIINNLDI